MSISSIHLRVRRDLSVPNDLLVKQLTIKGSSALTTVGGIIGCKCNIKMLKVVFF